MTQPVATIVVCTYQRLAMLEATLRSCLRDAAPDGPPFEIVVSDNSPHGHARELVDGLAAAGHPVRRVAAHPPNISVARNAGLRAARAPLVAFVDDDLEVERGWLAHLVETLEATGADVALGPVRPAFEEGSAPLWDPSASRWTRVLDAPTGSLFRVGHARPPGFVMSTASSIWRVATCFGDAEPFSPLYGRCGGEDWDLALRLEARGARFAWCAEAGVRETIPPGRTSFRYQLLRAYSGGQVYAMAGLQHQLERPMPLFARSLAQFAGEAAAAVLLAPWRARSARHALRAAGALGKLTWRRAVPLYHMEKPP